jgi:gliding motility-associated-like protein
VNGLSVSSNPVAFTTAGLANGDVVGLTLTSGAACPSVATVTATPITMTVATNLTPSVSIQASTTSECAGTSVSFLATPVNGGASPIYEWYINGVAQGVNSPNFSSSTLNQGDVVNVQLTSNASCASVSTVSSNSVFMTINPVLTPTIAISASATAICANEAVNFFATVADAGSSPTIQWYLNGNPVGSNNTVLTLSGLISSDVVTAMVTSTAVCTTTPTANSNAISLTVSNTVVPMAFITVPSTIFCPGSAVTFGSNITNGGATPTYDWYLNGTSTGITTPTYSTSTLSNGDVVMLVLTSSSTCASTPTVTSNSITMFSNTSATGSVNITSLTGSLCEGGTLTFIGIPQNVSGTINYQWTVNGVNAGTNNSVFTSTSLVANDAVELTISYQDACGNNLTATSNTITIQETPVVDAGTDVSIQTGTSVTLNGTTSVAGSILWSPAGSLSNASILTPTASPSLTTTYLLTVQTPNGCEASDVVTITIDQDVFEIFNSFSPNADGTNDTWNIPNASNYPEISVQIFNKWGNLLYEQNKVYVPWDGTNDGAKLPSDTYFYIVKLSPASDALKGSVTIVR